MKDRGSCRLFLLQSARHFLSLFLEASSTSAHPASLLTIPWPLGEAPPSRCTSCPHLYSPPGGRLCCPLGLLAGFAAAFTGARTPQGPGFFLFCSQMPGGHLFFSCSQPPASITGRQTPEQFHPTQSFPAFPVSGPLGVYSVSRAQRPDWGGTCWTQGFCAWAQVAAWVLTANFYS